MAQKLFNIVIKLLKEGNADKDTIRGLMDIKSALTSGLAVAGAVTTAYYAIDKVLDATVGKYLSYAKNVDIFSSALATTAEEGSKLIQLADDFGISSDAMQTAMFKAVKNGIEPTIEGLAKAADHYNSLGSAEEKAQYLQETFGKGSQEIARLLEGGSEAVIEHTKNLGALVLTQEDLNEARQQEIMLDTIADEKTKMQITSGKQLLPIYAALTKNIVEQATAYESLNLEAGKSMDPVLAAAMLERNQHIQDMTESIGMLISTTGEWSRQGNIFTQTMVEGSTAIGDYTDKFDFMWKAAQGYSDTQKTIRDLEAEIAEKRKAGYVSEAKGTVLGGLLEQLDEAKQKSQDLANQMILDMFKMKIAADGVITNEEIDAFFNMAEGLGFIDEQAHNAAVALWAQADAAAAAALAPHDFTYTFDYRVIGTPPSGFAVPGSQYQEYAEGGTLGQMSVVGERGWEAIVRTRDGRYLVIPHEASLWMQAAGLLGSAPGYAIGNLPLMDQAIGGGSGNQATGYIPKPNQATGLINPPPPNPNLQPFGSAYGSSAPSSAAVAAVEQASTQAAETAVESVAPVVAGAVQMFQAAQAANAQETVRQTRVAEDGNADTKRLLTAILNILESHPEMLAAEMQKHK